MSNRSAKRAVPQSARRVSIIVLGMHRSGTSAFARVLNLLGCDLPSTLMGASNNNEAGYWESKPICELNDRVLASGGTRWDDWLEFNPGWLQSPKAEEFRAEALALLQEEYGSSRLFVLKDPRICRLLPFWLDVLKGAGVRPLIVSVVRNPLEVAASLERRNGFNVRLGHLLWLRHALDGEFCSRGIPRFFANYDRLMNGWARIATEAESALGITWPRMPDQVAGEIESFLSTKYRHHREAPETVIENPVLTKWLREAFQILSEWAQAGEQPQDFAALDRIRAAMNGAAPAFSWLIATGQETAEKKTRLERELAEAQAKLRVREAASRAEQERATRLERELAEAQAKLRGGEAATRAEEERATRLERELAEAQAKLRGGEAATRAEQERATRLERELADAHKCAAKLQADIEKQTRAAEEAESSVTEMRHRLAQTESALAQRRHEAEQTAADLEAVREELRRTAAARAETEKVALGLKEHVTLLLADLKERQAAFSARDEIAAKLNAQVQEAEAVRQQNLHLQTRLGEQNEEIARLRQLLHQREGEAQHSRLQADRMRQAVAGEVSRAVVKLLNGRSPLMPFRLKRQIAVLQRSGIFDVKWYLDYYTDVARAGMDPLRHYIKFGAKEGRVPNPALAKALGYWQDETATDQTDNEERTRSSVPTETTRA